MHRIDGPAAAPGGLFTEGDPAVGTPATVVTDDWLNAVQEELVSVIAGAGIALSKPSNAQVLAAIRKLIAEGVPPGTIQAFAFTSTPTGWLRCNGQAVSRTAYSALFAAIGTLYGVGDGSTTFNLPELRGEFLRGWDDGRGVDAGRPIGVAQADMLKAHTHTLDERILLEGGAGGPGGTTSGSADIAPPTGSTGGVETRPRNVAVLYCIRV